MSSFQPVRGTHDLLPDDQRAHRFVVDTARNTAARYGFEEISTPIFEFTEVFARGMGETSDVVSKEMYSFADKGGETITLRPEYTAGICRAFLSNGLHQAIPLKFFAHGPMFRFERPQKGRQRQFHQIDVEIIGAPEPQADIEAITLAADILEELRVLDKCVLQLNSLGDRESRNAYRTALIDYFSSHQGRLSEESLRRLQHNPLRILDSKDAADRLVVAGAPAMTDYFTASAADFFAAVQEGLTSLGISYTVTPTLVRGLDYYTHTAFEFVTDALGAQGTLIGGGRYDGLIEIMGGPSTAGIGWAGGIERLALLAQGIPSAPRPVAIVPIGDSTLPTAISLARTLRQAGISIELAYRGNPAKRFKRANKVNASHAIVIGDDELAAGTASVKDLDQGEQQTVQLDALVNYFRTVALPRS